MKFRLIITLIALILAVVGVALVNGYVQAADQRAYAGAETVEVLVVETAIAAGTPVEEFAPFLTTKTIPVSAQAENAISDLNDHAGRVAAVDLLPGEQLLRERLVDPLALQDPGTVPVPEGLQEVTVQLGADRVIGGRLTAGDTVGIFVSTPQNGTTPPETRVLFSEVLVTSVQGAPEESVDPEADPAAAPAVPSGTLLVTFARSEADAIPIIHAAEFALIWLSKVPTEPGPPVPATAAEGSTE